MFTIVYATRLTVSIWVEPPRYYKIMHVYCSIWAFDFDKSFHASTCNQKMVRNQTISVASGLWNCRITYFSCWYNGGGILSTVHHFRLILDLCAVGALFVQHSDRSNSSQFEKLGRSQISPGAPSDWHSGRMTIKISAPSF